MSDKMRRQRDQNILAALQYLNKKQPYSLSATKKIWQTARQSGIPACQIKGHPLHTFMLENKQIFLLIEEKIMPALKIWQQDGKNKEALSKLKTGIMRLHFIKNHYVRKENSFYPLLVKYGLAKEGQTAKLWTVDDQVRELVKQVYRMLQQDPLPETYRVEAAVEKMRGGVLKNVFTADSVILPLLEDVVSVKDWEIVKRDEVEMGYCLIDLPPNWIPTNEEIDADRLARDKEPDMDPKIVKLFKQYVDHLPTIKVKLRKKDILRGDKSYPDGEANTEPTLLLPGLKNAAVKMEVGSLSLKEIPAIFNVLPIDLTFVDKHDRVKWFSNTDRIFPRTQSVIGRPVIRCHPPKSVDKVMNILDEFHQGRGDGKTFG